MVKEKNIMIMKRYLSKLEKKLRVKSENIIIIYRYLSTIYKFILKKFVY